MREPMCWVCPWDVCVVPLWTKMKRCVPLCGVRMPMRWVCRSSLDWDETMCTPVWGEGANVMGVRQTLDWVVMTCGLLPCGLSWVRLEMVLQMILLWTQWDRDLLSRTSLWLSTGGRASSRWALVDVWDPLLYCLRVRFTYNPNCDVKGTCRLHHMWKIINVYCNN